MNDYLLLSYSVHQSVSSLARSMTQSSTVTHTVHRTALSHKSHSHSDWE